MALGQTVDQRQISRRQLGKLGLAAVLAAGSRTEKAWANGPTLRVTGPQNLLPGSVFRDFERETPWSAQAAWVGDPDRLWRYLERGATIEPSRLQRWGAWLGWGEAPTTVPQVLLLGSDRLAEAIARDLIAPLPTAALGAQFGQLPAVWQTATRRGSVGAEEPELEDTESGDSGEVWGVPWRWGVTAIAYNRRFVAEPITDWSDLWRPDLQGKISLPDHPQEVIGLALKSLGLSYNAPLTSPSAELQAALARLHQQALFYSSTEYLQALYLKDSWVAVGWTSDLYQAQALDRDIEVVIPTSGSALWWEAWVLPAAAAVSDHPEFTPILAAWFDFLLQPAIATRIVTTTPTALTWPLPPTAFPVAWQARADLDPATLAQAEVLATPDAEALGQLLTLWQAMRLGELRA